MTTLIPKYDLDQTGTVNRPINQKFQEWVSVKDFGAVGDGSTDDTVAIQAARDYIAAQTNPPALIFPAGIYKYSTSPNWAIEGAEIIADGDVTLQYTGTDDAVLFDPGTPTGGGEPYVFRVKMKGFGVNCPSTAKNAVNVIRCGHSEFEFYVYGAGATYAGIVVDFCVTSIFTNCTVSKERAGGSWYLNSKPFYGFHLTSTYGISNEAASFNTFINPIAEFCDTGIYLDKALGNIFIGGTSEANTNIGLLGGTPSLLNSNNRFYGMDFENNTNYDVYDGTNKTEFHGISSLGTVKLLGGGRDRKLIGGNYQNIVIDANADLTALIGVSYNTQRTTGTITDNSGNARYTNVNDSLGSIYQQPAGALTPTGTSFTYTNTLGVPVQIWFNDSTGLSFRVQRNSVWSPYFSPNTFNCITLSSSDVLNLAYTTPPSSVYYFAMGT